MKYQLIPYGHRAWLLQFSADGFSKLLCQNILRLADIFRGHEEIWSEIVPAYDSLLLKLRPKVDRSISEKIITHALETFAPSKELLPADTIIDLSLIHI